MKTVVCRVHSMSFRQRHVYKTPVGAAVGAVVAAALCLKPSVPVHAADALDEVVTLDEVVVSATRRDESIQNTPYNISVVTSNTIDQLRLNKIDDVAHWVPGVSIQDQGTYGVSDIVMRGLNVSPLGADGGAVNGVAGAVAEYLGDIPLFFDFKLLDIDRVEALEGPQGTLYGSGSLGGLIRYVPKKPDLSKFSSEVHLRASSLKEAPTEGYDGDATVNVPLIDGKLAIRAVVGYYHDPGYIDDTRLVNIPGVSVTQPDINDPAAVAANLHTERGVNFDHTLSGRVTLLYRPNDVFEAELGYAHQKNITHGLEGTNSGLLGTGRYDFAARVAERADRKADVGSVVLTAHLGFADLVSASSYANRQVGQTDDDTGAFLGYGYGAFPSFVSFDRGETDRHLYAEELRMISTGQGHWKWVAGLFYQHFKDVTLDHEHQPGFPDFLGISRPDALSLYSRIENPFTDKAVFGELTYQFTPAWQVTLGGRWFKDTQTQTIVDAFPIYQVEYDGGPSTGIEPFDNFKVGGTQDSWIYKFNTSYRFTPDLMLYTTVSEGYRAGGINQVAPCTPNTPNAFDCLLPDEIVLKPDTTTNYEVGMRSTWLDKKLTLNGAVYYVKWRDLRVQGLSKNGTTFLTNGSAALSKGVELQFQAQLPYRLSLLGQYTFTDATLTAPFPLGGGVLAKDGDRLPVSPRHMGGLTLQWLHNLPGDYSFDASYGITARSNLFSKIANRRSGEILPGYATQDASIGLSKNNWNASLFVENLTNKYAFTGVDADPTFGGAVDGIFTRDYFHSVLRPREIGLELRMTF